MWVNNDVLTSKDNPSQTLRAFFAKKLSFLNLNWPKRDEKRIHRLGFSPQNKCGAKTYDSYVAVGQPDCGSAARINDHFGDDPGEIVQ